MEIRQLRYFLAVAEELHFGRAAQRLHMSQPPLSVQVGRLEEEIGTPLFERSTRRVSLTPAGIHLRMRAKEILADVDAAAREMREYADGLVGRLSAGFVSSANYTVLPGVVQLFRARRENVELALAPLTSGEQLERLRAGTLDVGIVRDELPPGDAHAPALVTEVVYEERLVVCVPVAHPLATRAELAPADIVEAPMIAYPRSLMPGFVDRVSAALAEAGRAPMVAEEVVHQETALSFVAAGVGLSVLPESVRQLVPPSIAVVPIAGSPTTRLLAAHPAGGDDHPARSTFVDCLREAAGALAAARAV